MTQDIYRELAGIRAHAQANTFFNALQTGLLSEMDASMHSIRSEMADARRLHEEGLAAQQEMLQREALQNYLEEFIYQTEKLVTQCKTNMKLPPSSRYFMLMSAAERLKQENISTPIIRGRDNKAAFDRVVTEIKSLAAALKQDREVQEAIAWAQAEQKRLAHERKSEKDKRRAQLKSEISQIERERDLELAKLGQPIAAWSHTYRTWIRSKFTKGGRGFVTALLIVPPVVAIVQAVADMSSGELEIPVGLVAVALAWFIWSGLCYFVASQAHLSKIENLEEDQKKRREPFDARLVKKQAELQGLDA